MIFVLLSVALYLLTVWMLGRGLAVDSYARVFGLGCGAGVLVFIVLRAVPGLQGLLLSFPALACLSFFGLSLACGMDNRRAALVTVLFLVFETGLWFALGAASAVGMR